MRQYGFVCFALGWIWWLAAAAFAMPEGRIEGRLTAPDGAGLAGVRVAAVEAAAETVTDAGGNFALAVAPGNYTLILSVGKLSDSSYGVQVPFAGTARFERTLDWKLPAAALAPAPAVAVAEAEPGAEPPVAVAAVAGEEIERGVAHGLLPKLVEHTPGAASAQGGLYDFNLNVRSFNAAMNRRLAVRLDGRDPAEQFFGFQEWAAWPLPLDEIAGAELARGPSSALYGADAASGALDLFTRRPRASRGGRIRLAGGELGTADAEARWAGKLAHPWFLRLAGGTRSSDGFTVSRDGQAEYSLPCAVAGASDCLPQEAVPLAAGDEEIDFGSLRLDRHDRRGGVLTIEGGAADVSGPVIQSGLGRLQIVAARDLWTRFNYSNRHWDFFATYKNRDAPRQTALATGDNLALDDQTWKGEVRTRRILADGRAYLVAGVAHEDERINSLDKAGPLRPALLNPLNRQTLLFEPMQSDADAFFARLDWDFGRRTKLTAALRYDDSSLWAPQLSARGSLVFGLGDSHTVRVTYHEGFQTPNYAEYFVQTDVEAPLNLASLEAICARDGVNCGFDIDFVPGEDPTLDTTADTRVLALGNRRLGVEDTRTLELGYVGRFGGRVRLTVDYHISKHDDLISDLLPQLGTSLGRVNPDFGPYAPPDDLSDAREAELFMILRALLGPRFPYLSNNVDGTPILAMASHANLGAAESRGFDLALDVRLDRGLSLAFSYSWLDFDLLRSPPGLADQLLPNTPENQASARLAYAGGCWNVGLSVRWVDDYRWVSLPFAGDVESYTSVDVSARVSLSEHWALGVHIANALDDEHYESFGGDLLGRRALASLSFDW